MALVTTKGPSRCQQRVSLTRGGRFIFVSGGHCLDRVCSNKDKHHNENNNNGGPQLSAGSNALVLYNCRCHSGWLAGWPLSSLLWTLVGTNENVFEARTFSLKFCSITHNDRATNWRPTAKPSREHYQFHSNSPRQPIDFGPGHFGAPEWSASSLAGRQCRAAEVD